MPTQRATYNRLKTSKTHRLIVIQQQGSPLPPSELAISMSATGMLLGGQSDAVLAANSTAPTSSYLQEITTEAEANASSDNPDEVVLAVPEIKRSIEKGESQKGLSSNYRVEQSTHLPKNPSEASTELELNQPAAIVHFNSQETAKNAPALAKQAAVIELAQDDLQETRKRLNQSMAMLKSEANPESPQTVANTIEVADASIAVPDTEIDGFFPSHCNFS